MPVDQHIIRDDAPGEDWPDETVAVIEAARSSVRECIKTYDSIMDLLAEAERLTSPGPRKHSKRRQRTRTEAEDGSPD